MQPIFIQARRIVKWYIHHPDYYTDLENTAAKYNLHFRRFLRETATRWSSQVFMLQGVLTNTEVQRLQKAQNPRVPAPFTDENRSSQPSYVVC